jgi:hypothetical protein
MKPKETTKATNVKHNTVRRRKQTHDNDPKKNIPLKNLTATLIDLSIS